MSCSSRTSCMHVQVGCSVRGREEPIGPGLA
jgi:hypothetical protein